MEKWKSIKNYQGLYEVSNFGKVRSLHNSSRNNNKKYYYLKIINHSVGYLRVNLAKNGVHKIHYIHRLVAEAFIENPDNLSEPNHIDMNKKNNKVNNLEWVSHAENLRHAAKNGAWDKCHLRKLKKSDVKKIRISKKSRKELAEIFNVTAANISKIVLKKSWKYI